MRFKFFTLCFLMGLFGLFTTPLFAQEDATIDPANIRYWIGDGENQVVFIVNWAEPNTALAWGYRFSEENVTVKDMMVEIMDTDPRFSFEGESGFVSEIVYEDPSLNLQGTPDGYWMYNVNGVMAMEYFDTQTVANGDYVKWGDTNCGTEIAEWTYVWEQEVTAVYPYAVEATIDPSEINYWIGEGENEVVFAVNWAEPNVCYAWGYRFNGENTVKDMMDAIAAVDNRFSYTGGDGMVYDIMFDANEEHYSLVGDYWMYNINGGMAWFGYDEQAIVNGDFVKFGDIACATEIAEWTYVWVTPVQPVIDNTSVNENETVSTLYPNPASSYTMLNVPMGHAEVTITDLQGRTLNRFAMNQNMGTVRIETSGYEAGVYFVTVSDGATHQTMKLVVK